MPQNLREKKTAGKRTPDLRIYLLPPVCWRNPPAHSKSHLSMRLRKQGGSFPKNWKGREKVTCLKAEAEVEESSIPEGTQEVVAALKGCHQDGARDNLCGKQGKGWMTSLRTWTVTTATLGRLLPPPSISLCSSSKDGSFRMRAEMSVQSPMAQSGDIPLESPRGVMSRQATSCSISVQLEGRREDRCPPGSQIPASQEPSGCGLT